MDEQNFLALYIRQAHIMIPRLERILPDSSCAHRATGLRRTLMRLILESPPNLQRLQEVVHRGYDVLEEAAREKAR